MNVKQRFFVLFFLKKGQALHDPRCSLFCRITIDGLREEISFSYKIAPEEWDNINKLVLPTHPKWKEINKKMSQASVDIERHFDLLQLKHEIATPAMVKKSYLSPLSAQQVKNEIGENLAFDDALDTMITRYIQFFEKYRRFNKRTSSYFQGYAYNTTGYVITNSIDYAYVFNGCFRPLLPIKPLNFTGAAENAGAC